MHVARSLSRAIVRRLSEGKSVDVGAKEYEAMDMPVGPHAFKLLDELCECLMFANTADSDRSSMPSDISSGRGCFGHIHKAIDAVLVAHGLPLPEEVNWGGNESFLADLLIAVRES